MLLARTMTVAYTPGLALAVGTQFLVGTADFRTRLRNVTLAAATALIVAGPWYIRNASSVYDVLVGSGYGEGAVPFGRHYPVASWGFWTKELRLDLSYMGLPLAGVLFLCFGLAVAYLLARHKRLSRPHLPLTVRSAGVLALVLVILEGYLVLTSSRNEGTGLRFRGFPRWSSSAWWLRRAFPARTIRVALASTSSWSASPRSCQGAVGFSRWRRSARFRFLVSAGSK